MSYWNHRNLSIFNYAQPLQASAGPVNDKDDQALRDWNRWAVADTICPLYIGEQNLSTLRQKKGFTCKEELIDFFKEHLFPANKYPPETQAKMAQQAYLHLHQAGLFVATNYSLNNTSKATYKAVDPIQKITLNATDKGLTISEHNTYTTLVNSVTGQKSSITKANEFFAQTQTTTLFDDRGIKLLDLEIDCPCNRLGDQFDKRGLLEKLECYIKRLLIDWKILNAPQVYEPIIEENEENELRVYQFS